jgi:large subunit ribosomal protein L21
MYAVVETGGKQYRVTPGGYVEVEKLPVEVGTQVTFDRVLLLSQDGAAVQVGTPLVAGASINATVVGQRRYRKVVIFHYQAKKRERKKRGHRQPFTRLRIDGIQA